MVWKSVVLAWNWINAFISGYKSSSKCRQAESRISQPFWFTRRINCRLVITLMALWSFLYRPKGCLRRQIAPTMTQLCHIVFSFLFFFLPFILIYNQAAWRYFRLIELIDRIVCRYRNRRHLRHVGGLETNQYNETGARKNGCDSQRSCCLHHYHFAHWHDIFFHWHSLAFPLGSDLLYLFRSVARDLPKPITSNSKAKWMIRYLLCLRIRRGLHLCLPFDLLHGLRSH